MQLEKETSLLMEYAISKQQTFDVRSNMDKTMEIADNLKSLKH